MIPDQKSVNYYAHCNESLLRVIPTTARRVLEVGCGTGNLGARLKSTHPACVVMGIDQDPIAAGRAALCLDRVFTLDVQQDDPPLEPGSVDCIVYGDVLEHLLAPEPVLTRYKRFLTPGGIILCSVPNVQHFSVVAALLKSDFQYASAGLLDAAHLRFYTYSTFLKVLLDAGFAPSILKAPRVACPPEFLQAVEPLLRFLDLDPRRTERYLSAYQYIFQGRPLPPPVQPGQPSDPNGSERPLSFVTCVSNEETLQANLLSSPCLEPGSCHELILLRGYASAAEGLNLGLTTAGHPVAICVHQDVYLPRGWPERFWAQHDLARQTFGPIGVLGVYGAALRNDAPQMVGHVVDRDRLLCEDVALPAQVDTLDELLLAVPRETSLTFDPDLGFHLYGADLCLSARERGLAAVAIDALCFHNSAHVDLPPAFYESGRVFARKWRMCLPIVAPCVLIDGSGRALSPTAPLTS